MTYTSSLIYMRVNVTAGRFFFLNLGHIPQIRAARAVALMIFRLDCKQTLPRLRAATF